MIIQKTTDAPGVRRDAAVRPVHKRNVVPIGAATVIGAALRAARRGADAQTRHAISTSLAGCASMGCAASPIVLRWFERDTAICFPCSNVEGARDDR